MDHPLVLLGLTALSLYVANQWWSDQRAARGGASGAGAWPGATPATNRSVWLAVAGALALLVVETAGELALGLTAEQSRMTWLFALYSIVGAPVIEELIFRGFIVVERHGPAMLWLAAFGASVIFAVLHPFLWHWDDEGFRLTFTAKGIFSTAVVFAVSLWLYAARFAPWNPTRSLLPCVAAHAAKNAGVVAIKAATGFVGPLW